MKDLFEILDFHKRNLTIFYVDVLKRSKKLNTVSLVATFVGICYSYSENQLQNLEDIEQFSQLFFLWLNEIYNIFSYRIDKIHILFSAIAILFQDCLTKITLLFHDHLTKISLFEYPLKKNAVLFHNHFAKITV